MNRKERRSLEAKSRKNGSNGHIDPAAKPLAAGSLPRLEGPSLEAVQLRFRNMQQLKAHHSDQIRALRQVEQQIDRAEQDLGQLSTTLLLSLGIDANADPAVRYVIDPESGQVHRVSRQGAPAPVPASAPAPELAKNDEPPAAEPKPADKRPERRVKAAAKEAPAPVAETADAAAGGAGAEDSVA